MSSASDGVRVELRGGRAVAWRVDDGHAVRVAAVRVQRRGRHGLRVSVGAHVRLAVSANGRWRRVGSPQPLPSWTTGPRVALTAGGPPQARAAFGRLWIAPR